MGYDTLPVYARLNIGIVSTGDELKSPGQPLKHGEITNPIHLVLQDLLNGQVIVRFGFLPSPILWMPFVKRWMKRPKLATSSSLGGVSMGEFDYVRRLMEEEGDIHFWRMKIRPGSPPLFGLWNDTPLFGLPETPSRAMLCSECWSHPIFAITCRRMRQRNGKSEQSCATLSIDQRLYYPTTGDPGIN